MVNFITRKLGISAELKPYKKFQEILIGSISLHVLLIPTMATQCSLGFFKFYFRKKKEKTITNHERICVFTIKTQVKRYSAIYLNVN